jgi:hypothetical protein
VDPRAGLDGMEKLKFWAIPWLELRPLCPSARKPVAIPTELPKLIHFDIKEKRGEYYIMRRCRISTSQNTTNRLKSKELGKGM